MKKYLLFLAIISIGMLAKSEVHKQGIIINERWDKPNSPYIIDGAILVASLVIEPGVEVKFSGNYLFEVQGILTAIGSPCDSIKFFRDAGLTWQGILFRNSTPGTVMKWCVIANANTSGIRIFESFPKISYCSIQNNTSSDSGGGIKISNTTIDSVLEISFCNVIGNTTPSSNGAGIWIQAQKGSVKLRNCTIRGNQCTKINGYAYGGGAYADGNVQFTLCTIADNVVRGYSGGITGVAGAGNGGGIYISSGTVTILNAFINNNRAEGFADFFKPGYAYGGGVHVGNGTVSFFNSIISNDTASGQSGSFGGGLFINAGASLIENCTFAYNNPHATHNNADTVSMVNSIVYFNNNNGAQVTGKLKIAYSDVQNGYAGSGNINFSPIFQGAGVYKIVPPSRCIDAGNDSLQYQDSCFPPSLGNVRNDMGAHGGPRACTWNDTIGVIGCTPFPVTRLYFNGQQLQNNVQLTWATASEQNSKEFIIERSLYGTQFIPVNAVQAAGNSNQIRNYGYLDNDVLSLHATQLFYRLRQVDMDGKSVYSNTIAVPIQQTITEPIIKAFPNPFTNSIRLQISGVRTLDSSDNVEIYSLNGKLLYHQNLVNGNSLILLDGLSSLSPGLYLLKTTLNGKAFTNKITKQ